MKEMKKEQISVLTAPYLQHTLEYAFDSIAANGYKKVELWGISPHYCLDDNRTLPERVFRVKEIRKMLDDRGLIMSMFHPEQHRQYPYNIATENDYIRSTTIAHMKLYMEDALELGTNRMILCPGWQPLDESPEKTVENYKRAVAAIQEIADSGKKLGVTLYLEEMSTLSSPFVDNMKKLEKLVADISMDNVQVSVDTGRLAANGNTFADYKKTFGQVNFVHVTDITKAAILDGGSPLSGYLARLAEADYTGDVSICLWGADFHLDPDGYLRRL